MRLFGRKKKKESPDFSDFPPIGGLMVSKLIAEQGYKPLFMYREKRDRPEDSGWRIFSGYESEEYTNDPNNTGIYHPSTILKIDPSIADLLLKGVGSVFERQGEKEDWYLVDDFELEDDFMVEHQLTDQWKLRINNLFERNKEENGDLVYTTGDKTLRIAIWDLENKTQNEALQEHHEFIHKRDQRDAPTMDTFEFSDDQVKRVGYEIQEGDERKTYGVIYGFSISQTDFLQLAFYFDSLKDKQWALETWKNIGLSKG